MVNEHINDDSFFKTNNINLNYSGIITDLINKIDNNKFIFSKTNDNDKIRILRRISFVIYSYKSDTFNKQFDIIKFKAKVLLSGRSDKIIESEFIFNIGNIIFEIQSRWNYENDKRFMANYFYGTYIKYIE